MNLDIPTNMALVRGFLEKSIKNKSPSKAEIDEAALFIAKRLRAHSQGGKKNARSLEDKNTRRRASRAKKSITTVIE